MHRLCLAIGGCTVEELKRRLSGESYENWVRYYNTEPFGAPRREQMHADMMTSLWALHGGSKAPNHLREPDFWKYNATDSDEELDESAVRAKLGV